MRLYAGELKRFALHAITKVSTAAATITRSLMPRARRALVPFALGCAVGWIRSQPPEDPNRAWDPQAVESLFCDRDETSRVSGGIHSWSAVALVLTCGVIGKKQTRFVYLLKPGQRTSPATLVVSYQGSTPRLRWRTPTSLLIQTDEVHDVIQQAAMVGDVVVDFKSLLSH